MNYSFIVLISCIATIGGFLFGFDSGVINGAVDGLRIAFQSDSVGTGFNVASMLLGCAGGRSSPVCCSFRKALGSWSSAARQRPRAVLTRLYGPEQGATKLTEIDESLAADHHRPKFSDLIDGATGRIRTLVWVGIGLATFQQLVGINVVFYYGAVLWQAVGFSESDALLINVISGAVSIGACIITVSLIDRIGRKPLLWIGSSGMAVTLAIMAAAFSTATLDDQGALQLTSAMGTLALVAANLYVFFFNGSWGPVMWVMLGEMFPNQIRGSGLALSGLAQWGSNFGITMTFPILLGTIGLMGAYSLYALAVALGWRM